MQSRKLKPMKKILPILLLFGWFSSFGQAFNNEWIKYDQTYYKIKVGKAGVYRLPKTVLDAAGVGNVSVEFFELWKNGQKVPVYPSVNSGTLPAGGYLEFWGEPNDGKADKPLYRDPRFQHTDANSLIWDTAVYFLSVNTTQTGFFYLDLGNDVASNTLAPEPFFMHKASNFFKRQINPGYAVVVGEYLYSSSYDKGEFWSSAIISPSAALSPPAFTNLYVDSSGPSSIVRFGASGNVLNTRHIRVRLNNTQLIDTVMDYFNDVHTSVTVPTSMIYSNSAAFQFQNTSTVATDRMVVSYYELEYPRKFNFGNQTNFKFKLPGKTEGYYLEITNFNSGGIPPVLYDLSFGQRIVANTSVAGKLRFAIPAFDNEHEFVLVSQHTSNITQVSSMETKNFVPFNNAANQGDYLIISNKRLFTGTNGNDPVLDYKNYRESDAGGNYQAIVVDIDELVDQFAFGINKHPLSIKNFLRYARNRFPAPPKFAFIIGRGMAYNEYYNNRNNAVSNNLNLVPTFGNPASDNLLSSDDGANPIAVTPIGRLSVVSAKEIEDYTEKIKEYELAQQTAALTIDGRGWMKNIVHVTGSSDPYLGTVLCNYMSVYRSIIQDTIFGGKVTTFCKTSTNPVEQLGVEKIADLFEEGISILTYFGHSSSTTLEFNLDNPEAYNNPGKYPVFFVNGCNAGNFFTYNPQRLVVNETLSEKFVLAKQRGSIAFVASTHFGIVNYLNLYLSNLYKVMGRIDYGKPLGIINRDALKFVVNEFGPVDFYSRMHAEQITVHGDPAIYLNGLPKPDYIIEQPQIKISPSFLSVAEKHFTLNVSMFNLGRAVRDSITVDIKRQLPDGTTVSLFNQKIAAIRSVDSIKIIVPIVATRDKGQNKIFVTLDALNNIDEASENNNTASAEFFVFEDEARPVYPYNFAIVTDPAQKLFASTADPFSPEKMYVVEVDTTEEFNSPLMFTKTLNAKGGVFEVETGISYRDSVVYYWRVAPIPAQGEPYKWNASSFVYISTGTTGWNQSHYYQFLKNAYNKITLNNSQEFSFEKVMNSLSFKSSLYPYGSNSAYQNGSIVFLGGCGSYLNSLEFLIFDMRSGKNIKNAVTPTGGRYGSLSPLCPDNGINKNMLFDFYYNNSTYRKRAMDFIDSLPNGTLITMMNYGSMTYNSNPHFIDKWQSDTALYGTYQSIYHKLLGIGLTEIDSFYRNIPFIFTFSKNFDGSFTVMNQQVGANSVDLVSQAVEFESFSPSGEIISEVVGPAREWKSLHWRGSFKDSSTRDSVTVSVYGITPSMTEELLFTSTEISKDTTLDFVSAASYPQLRFKLQSFDDANYSPFQLEYWQAKFEEVPEGVIQPSVVFDFRDTVEVGEKSLMKVSFRNISKTSFDSLQYKLVITDNNNNRTTLEPPKVAPLAPGDSITVSYEIDTRQLTGANSLFVDINPDIQPEQYRFNNFLFRNFYVRPDLTNPLLDVTFDGMHILNQDIVSAKPHIRISLKDEAKHMLLDDTAISSIQVRYPNGQLRTFKIDNDTLRFTPAASGTDNTATFDFYPSFLGGNEMGEDYELIVKGKDMSGNKAGEIEYRIGFKVISKPMISNMLNFPNPFSTSTAFVFTITGSEVPQNMKIQILTVTGKVVREITREELGPLNIGRNITEFKWDGTDQFGQKLANGVYLYRVVSMLNGQRMEKYRAKGDDTDRFFNNGYGKMYLMR